MKIIHVIGARPNFMKAAPLVRALSCYPHLKQQIVHTGQHYDANMSDVFFQELGIPAPDVNLRVGSGSHAVQTAEIMRNFEPVVLEYEPDLVLVYGDVNSTIAAALVCAKLSVPVGHVEAGLRSFDRTMPEEINRILTDQISDMLFTPSSDGNNNLENEGIATRKIHLVGNVMIDTLIRMLPRAQPFLPKELPERYALVTLHRSANVDDLEWLTGMLRTLADISTKLPVIFPMHPRTRERMRAAGIATPNGTLRLSDPLSYLTFLALQQRAAVVITDSGGIQEETTYLQVPCLTVRENTERPITISLGTNELVGRNVAAIRLAIERVVSNDFKRGTIPPLWDGHAAERIAQVIAGRS